MEPHCKKFLVESFGELFRGEVRGEICGLEVESEPALFVTGNGEVAAVEDLGRAPALGRASGLLFLRIYDLTRFVDIGPSFFNFHLRRSF